MSDRYDTEYPEDEPVIGGYSPSAAPPPPAFPPFTPSQQYIGTGGQYEDSETIGYADSDEDDYDDEYADDDFYDDYDYEETAPARQPMFYVFVALAALVGGIVVFLLFSLVNNGDDGGPSGGGDTKFAVAIDSPPKDKRIEIGKTEEVIVQASATEAITRFELFAGDKLTDTVNVTETPPDNKYRAVMKLTLTAKGNYDLMVRVTASSGATKESSKIRVIAIEPVGERPQTIKGKVVADTILRAGPGESFPESGSLKAGTEVTILGKNRAIDWLLVESPQGQRWARRTAISELDTLDLVPVREPTATPAPTREATSTTIPSATASASASASPNPNAPDFVPTNAVLAAGGAILRVTIQNVSTNAYNGPLVIGISGDAPADEVAIDAKLNGNGGTATIEFTLNPPITTAGKKAVVSVDPKNAVKEAREDNNGATFVLLPPEEAPNITIQSPLVQPSAIAITIQNDGGAMAATTVTVRVKLGSSVTQEEKSIALAKGQSASFSVARPQGSGNATVEVLINGQVVATANFTITP